MAGNIQSRIINPTNKANGNNLPGNYSAGGILGSNGTIESSVLNVSPSAPPFTHAKSVAFNGTSSSLAIPSGINVGANVPRTWLGWVKINSFAGNPVWGATSDGTRTQYFYFDVGRGDVVAIDWFDASHEIFGFTTTPLTAATWVHIAIVNSGTNLITGFSVYVNAVLQGMTNQINQSGGNYLSTAAYFLGDGFGANFLNGEMNSFAIYNSALSSSDITAAYNGGTPVDLSTLPSYSHIVAWYQMGNFSGDSTSTILNSANPGTFNATGSNITIVTDSP